MGGKFRVKAAGGGQRECLAICARTVAKSIKLAFPYFREAFQIAQKIFAWQIGRDFRQWQLI
jgi:hypothetical protein